jgi:hypothetical protein
VKKKTTKNKSKERLVSFFSYCWFIQIRFDCKKKTKQKYWIWFIFFLSISFHSYLILFLDFFHSCQLPLF